MTEDYKLAIIDRYNTLIDNSKDSDIDFKQTLNKIYPLSLDLENDRSIKKLEKELSNIEVQELVEMEAA